MQQPIGAAMYSPASLRHYKSGVLTDNYLLCSSGKDDVNHAVVIVGFGKVQAEDKVFKSLGSCKEYWIVRNSWGSSWGEQGFFKLCMDGTGDAHKRHGTCLINSYAMYPTLH